jgi:hypothetical protein
MRDRDGRHYQNLIAVIGENVKNPTVHGDEFAYPSVCLGRTKGSSVEAGDRPT